jgi:hypothetical protein
MVQARLVLLALLLGCAPGAGGTHAKVPCDAGDLADQAALAAHAVGCRARVQECGADQDCRNAAIADCDQWGDKLCAEGAGGAK